MTTPSDIPDIDATDLAPITDTLVELLAHLDELTPDWRAFQVVKNSQGEAVLLLYDGSEEVMRELPLRAQLALKHTPW